MNFRTYFKSVHLLVAFAVGLASVALSAVYPLDSTAVAVDSPSSSATLTATDLASLDPQTDSGANFEEEVAVAVRDLGLDEEAGLTHVQEQYFRGKFRDTLYSTMRSVSEVFSMIYRIAS